MTSSIETDISDLIVLLTKGETPRVWSLLVTVFGDLAQDQGQWISAATLTRITAAVGLKPEATRVALHRLRGDDWLMNRKTGRRSDYSLTTHGRAQSASANPRIYGPGFDGQNLRLIITAPSADAGADVLHWVAPRIGLAEGAPEDALALPIPDAVPEWLRGTVCPAGLLDDSARLAHRLTALRNALPVKGALDALETAVLRVLIVHGWRRLILRSPPLPDALFPDRWHGPECRTLVGDLLKALPRPDVTV